MGRKIVALLLTFILCVTSVYAAGDSVTFLVDGLEMTQIELESEEIDNSNLPVTVIKRVGETETIIYTGPLGRYDNGSYIHTDFSLIAYLMVVDISNQEEVIFIIPIVYTDENGEIVSANETINGTEEITATQTSVIEYELEYEMSEDNESINITCTLSNTSSNQKTATLIAAIYENNALKDTKISEITVSANATGEENHMTIQVPEDNETCSVKLMVWDGFGTIRPLGETKYIVDFDTYSKEKHIFITAPALTEFNIFMNMVHTKGNTAVIEHTLSYDTTKFTPVDLCGLTYEKELTEGNINNINIKTADLQSGKITYQFTNPAGRNTGINNVVRFKALSDVTNAEITYTIQ